MACSILGAWLSRCTSLFRVTNTVPIKVIGQELLHLGKTARRELPLRELGTEQRLGASESSEAETWGLAMPGRLGTTLVRVRLHLPHPELIRITMS